MGIRFPISAPTPQTLGLARLRCHCYGTLHRAIPTDCPSLLFWKKNPKWARSGRHREMGFRDDSLVRANSQIPTYTACEVDCCGALNSWFRAEARHLRIPALLTDHQATRLRTNQPDSRQPSHLTHPADARACSAAVPPLWHTPPCNPTDCSSLLFGKKNQKCARSRRHREMGFRDDCLVRAAMPLPRMFTPITLGGLQ